MTPTSRLGRGEFAKYHALGNDYLVVDAANLGFRLSAKRVRALCDRNTGVGGDGVLMLAPPPPRRAAFRLRIFNPDGSEAEKSGNGLRIFARALFDLGYTRRTAFDVETAGGLVPVELSLRRGRVYAVAAEMGRAAVAEAETLDAGGERVRVVPVSVGNPHCVVFADELDDERLARLGRALETHARFPGRTNVQLARVRSRGIIELRIWERGAGMTRASGSSACAVAAAAFELGLVDGRVEARMPGGKLDLRVRQDLTLRMKGPATPVFRGRLF